MKYVKILGLLAVAAAAMMAFAASASATSVTTTTGGAAATPTIHAVNEGGHVSLANSVANIECASTTEGKVESHGAGVPAAGNITNLSFTGCTNSWTVSVNAAGSLSVTSTSGHNGTLSSSGATVTAERHTIFGTITCRYATNNTHIGTVTGGSPATLKIEGKIPFHSGGGLCGSGEAQWSGNYVTTSALYVASAGGCCGEGGGGGSIDIEPSSKKFQFTEWQNFRIKNTGPGSATINNLTLSITKGTGSAFVVEDPNGCKGKTLSSGGTCEITITCWEWEAHGSLTVDTSAGSATATFNSTP